MGNNETKDEAKEQKKKKKAHRQSIDAIIIIGKKEEEEPKWWRQKTVCLLSYDDNDRFKDADWLVPSSSSLPASAKMQRLSWPQQSCL